MPLLPYYAESLGAKPIVIGLLAATYSLFQFFAAPILGELSDKIGRRPVLLFSLAGTVISFFLLGMSNTLFILFISRIIDGASGGNISTAQAYIADITDKKSRTQGMGFMAAASSLGMILGPAMGGILSRFGYSVPAYLAGFIALIATVLTYFYLPESRVPNLTIKKKKSFFNISDFYDAITRPHVGLIIIIYFLILLAFTIMQGTFALFTEHTLHFSIQYNGYSFAYLGVVAVIIQLFFLKKLLKWLPETKIATWGVVSMALAFGLLAASKSIPLLLISLTFMALGQSISIPILNGLISKLTPEEEQGNIMGVTQSIGSIARLIGPVLGTLIYSQISIRSPYFFAATILALTALTSFFGLRQNQENKL
jgi:DHA1 family tetracycline resistance protein-like MFS transporter